MSDIEYIKSFDQIKILADPRRMAILRLLMAAPATITQLGRQLEEHPAWIRHHVKRLEEAGLVGITHIQVSGRNVEKFYQAKAGAFIFQNTLLPDLTTRESIVILGSHDIALELLAQYLKESGVQSRLLILPVGSLEGLVALRQGLAHLTGCHLLDAESGEYNRPYVRHFFPDRLVSLITLAHRVQGLMFQPGSSRKIRGLEDLAEEDVVLVNRNPGSGTRLWLEAQLSRLGIPVDGIRGYSNQVSTHTAVAHAISEGQANAGLGLEAVARQFDLEFIPLFQERYDLVIPQGQSASGRLQPMLDAIQSMEFRHLVSRLAGYDTLHTGEQLNL